MSLRGLFAAVVRRLHPPDTDDLDRELRAHLELESEEQREAGLAAADAARRASRLIGNRTLVKEEVRQMSPWIWWERLLQDVRYGLRGLRRNPAFAVTAVSSLALGIGANTAIFSVTNAVMMRPLPVERPDELVLLTNGRIGNFSYPAYRELRDRSRSFAPLMAAAFSQRVPVTVGNDTELAFAKLVSGNYFTGLGIPPAAGRLLTVTDEVEPVVVLSHGYWLRRFGGSPAAVGQLARVNGVAVTIIGVAPATFFGEAPGEMPDVWTSFGLMPTGQREEKGFTWLYPIGRLEPGTTIAQASAEIDAVVAQLQPKPSNDSPLQSVEIAPGARGAAAFRNRVSAPLVVLTVTSGLVLVIACMNLGSLLLTRGTAREPEIAMRLAIGATGGRILRQLMTESLLLASAGGALGVAFAFWGSRALVSLVASGGRGMALNVDVDGFVLLFAAAVSVAAALLFGVAPAVRAVRAGRGHGLMAGQRVVGRERRWFLRDSFVVVQIALSLVLLAAATMFVRTLRNLEAQDLGFSRDNRLVVSLTREQGYRPDPGTLVSRLLERIEAVPGVEAASVAAFGTLAGGGGVMGLQFAGYTPKDPQDQRARANWVGPSYFRATGIPLIGGRDFLPSDNALSQRVAVVSETTSRHYFGSENAIGRHFTFNKNDYEIIGVARDAKYADLRETTPRVIYFATLQNPTGFATIEVRTSRGEPAAYGPAIRAAVSEVEPRLSVSDIVPVTAQVDRSVSNERMIAALTSFFGALVLLLVSVGVYGTLAFTAAKRTREIGVRLALGSDRSTVVWMVLKTVAGMLVAGVTLGAMGVFATGRLVGSLLFKLEPMDPVTIAVSASLLISVALLAGSLPAIRASRLDPAKVLRE